MKSSKITSDRDDASIDFDEDLDRIERSMGNSKKATDKPTFESTALGQALSLSPSRDSVSIFDLGNARHGDGDNTEYGNQHLAVNRVDSIEHKLQVVIRKAMMTETAMRHLFVHFDKIGAGKFQRWIFAGDKLGIDATKDGRRSRPTPR